MLTSSGQSTWITQSTAGKSRPRAAISVANSTACSSNGSLGEHTNGMRRPQRGGWWRTVVALAEGLVRGQAQHLPLLAVEVEHAHARLQAIEGLVDESHLLARREEEDTLGLEVRLDEGPNDVELLGQLALRSSERSMSCDDELPYHPTWTYASAGDVPSRRAGSAWRALRTWPSRAPTRTRVPVPVCQHGGAHAPFVARTLRDRRASVETERVCVAENSSV